MTKTFDSLLFTEYKIVFDSNDLDNPHRVPHHIRKLLQSTFKKIHNKKKDVLPELNALISNYPDVPQFKNYLSVYYSLKGDMNSAFEVNQKIVAEHPDYLFGKINLAQEYLRNKEFEKVPEILGEAMELKSLYPQRNTFHIDEVMSFLRTSIDYFLETDNIEAAESRLKIMQQLEEDNPKTKSAYLNVTQYKLRKRFAESNLKRQAKPKIKPKRLFKQTKESPVFVNPQIDYLYKNGIDVESAIIKTILELPRESLVSDLRLVLKDGIQRYKYFKNEIAWNDNTHSFILHAMFLLKELKAPEALDDILNILRMKRKLLDFWLGEILTEDVWKVIFETGKDQLDRLKEYMLEEGNFCYARSEVSVAVSQIAIHHPERREEVLSWYLDLIRAFIEKKENKKLIDEGVIGLMIGDLLDIRAVELKSEIAELYENNLVDYFMAGELDYVIKDLNHPQFIVEKRKIKDIYSIYETWIRLSEPKAKANDSKNEVISETPVDSLVKPCPKTGRNELCPCGSGLKYKKCHGK